MNCRHCSAALRHDFLDLGFAPPSNAYLERRDLIRPEKYYPLNIKVCDRCWLVQTEDYADANELFSPEYAYFSSTSAGWLAHAEKYATAITGRLGLDRQSMVIELACNDGYLLKHFVAAGIPCLGVEPTASTAAAAEKLGIPVIREFFGEKLGQELAARNVLADLVAGNNVYAHVPDINDFTKGMRAVLKPGGTITLEFPHLLRMIDGVQFDTAYHEHFSYLSLGTVSGVFHAAGLRVWDVEELPTHGGSLRVYGCHLNDQRKTLPAVEAMISREAEYGLRSLEIYNAFQTKANRVKDAFVEFLIEAKQAGSKVAAYGAAAKGNTLLNYGGVKTDLLTFVCDAAASKQGKFMPGSHIPILSPEVLERHRPDFLVILPWNIAAEVMEKHRELASRGTKFVTAVPKLVVV